MGRSREVEIESAGNESFLDVTTNIVGILIILVIVVGQRAGSRLVEAAPAPANQELVKAQAESRGLEDEIRGLSRKMADLQAATAAKAHERSQLSLVVSAVEQELEKQRKLLDSESQSRYEYDREMALARDELDKLASEQRMAEEAAKPETVTIENHPTPLGKAVDGDEAHLQLSRGRLTVLPYQHLMNQLRTALRSVVNQMGNQSEHVDTLGPIEGYRLRYIIQRTEVPQGAVFQLAYVEFLPVSTQLGEPVEEAMRPGSNFRRSLERMSPHAYTITVWTYPDSFEEFTKLKKDLYAMGYTVAARPLPEGRPIAASPMGTRSSAQ